MTHRFLRRSFAQPSFEDLLISGSKMSGQNLTDSYSVSAGAGRLEVPANPTSATATASWNDQTGRPVELYIPEHYEPNYPYPLLVWLHGSGGSEGELSSIMPAISERNHFGIAFRGSHPGDGNRPFGFRWSQTEADYTEFRRSLYQTVCLLRGRYHIHSERIFIAGFDDGATLAMKLLLDRPEWFGGAAAFAGGLPRQGTPLVRYRELRGRRVLLGCGARDRRMSPAEMVRVGRLLHTAGMDVSTRVFDAAHEVTPAMLADLNQFILNGICTAA